jgi:spermidine synthase
VDIVTADGFKYLEKTDKKYDVIYMDAFLKPSKDTDDTGVPLNLKTIKFYKDTQTKLTPDGLMVFNINGHDKVADDIKNIRDAFPQTYVFGLSFDSGYIVVGSMSPTRVSADAIMAAAGVADNRFKTNFSFRGIARTLGKN